MSEEKQETLSLEENFALLRQTVEALEADEISLEDAFACYSKGMELLKTCNDQIDRVEKQVLVLSEGGELKEF